MVWLKWGLFVLAALALAAIALSSIGASHWQARTDALLQRLEAARLPVKPIRYDAARELVGLPAPVQRYFRTVLTDGQPMIAAVDIEHRGTFNLGASTPLWRPFTSRQRVALHRSGFVWDGRVAVLPGLNVHVHDAYVAGEGVLNPALLGLFSLADLRGGGEIARGELMRFVAEAAWYPTALLPSQGVRWAPIDEYSARATVVDGDITLSLDVEFAKDGTMRAVRADARGRTVAGEVVMTPWEGRWSDLRQRDGMRVPVGGEVAWLTPEGRRPYWRGRISSMRYEFAQ